VTGPEPDDNDLDEDDVGLTLRSVRGAAGKDAGGATETTMLIWKTIDANPGITDDEIFAKIEHRIPAAWALRRYDNDQTSHGLLGLRATPKAEQLKAARRYILRSTLNKLRGTNGGRNNPRIRAIENGGYIALEPPHYKGNLGKLDETGEDTRAHVRIVSALRRVEALLARVDLDTKYVTKTGAVRRSVPRPSIDEWAAISELTTLLRARIQALGVDAFAAQRTDGPK
jgi:hypothetical protein